MGLFDRFRKVQAIDSARFQVADYFGAWRIANDEYLRIQGLSASQMWRTQPYLRIVVNFMARNIAQLGLQTFQRVGETDRQRVREGGIASALAAPNPATTAYELIHGLVADLALYDTAFWLLAPGTPNPIVRVPVPWVSEKGGDALGPAKYVIRSDDRGNAVEVDPALVVKFHGWDPTSLTAGSTPLQALKDVLAEQVQAAKYRRLVWERGGKVGAALSRPKDAPKWSEEARKQFKKDWDDRFTGDGSRVGGTPLLEDGMTLTRVDFSAHEMEFMDGARLALNTVASAYHIPPPMVGLLENANYANVREFRKMLYGDTLGPVIAALEDRINTFVLPKFDTRPGLYTEFNVAEKLQGNFEEQATALQSAVGAPWMLREEARARMNLPAIPGADQLVVPLNVLAGAQASPTDSGTQNERPKIATYRVKAATQPQRDKITEVLQGFFARQGKSVLSAIGAGQDWWDGDRWDTELADDLSRVTHTLAGILGKTAAESFGYPDGYDPAKTVHFFEAVAKRYAGNINTTTKNQLDAALDADTAPADVFTQAKDVRAPGTAQMVGTFVAGFATVEAAKQIAASQGTTPTKTWLTGPNPRPEHAAMNGETVGINDLFSNGLDWPGSGGVVDEVAGCNCDVSVSF